MTRISYLTILLFILPMVVFGQSSFTIENPFAKQLPASPTGVVPCYSDQLAHEQFKNDPQFRQNYAEINKRVREITESQNRQPFDTSVIYIPVVVHVIHLPGTPEGTAENITMSKIQSQIRVLNEDFRKIPGTNGDGNGVDTKIEFFLAQKDPNGNCTDGVVRVASNLTNHNPNQAAALKALSWWDNTKYLNMWVVRDMGSVLGYATFPGGTPALDGVVIVYTSFGDEAPVNNPYHLGRTAAHEVGHYLNLFHTFQGGCHPVATCANAGDQVCDTPPVDAPNFGCPTTHNSCTQADGPDQVDNYMDYSDDACYSMFSAGQSTRMHASIQASRPSFLDTMTAIDAGFYGCLGINYCESSSLDSSASQIVNVSFSNVNNGTGPACSGYSDYTDKFGNEVRDSTFSFSVTTAACAGGTAGNHQVVAYFDWNQNGDFTDPGEKEIIKSYGSGTGTFSANVQVPKAAALGKTGVRVICTQDTAVSPCASYAFGETEDYAIDVINNPPVITDFFPKSGSFFTQVTIVGENLDGLTDILFNGVSISNDGISITFVSNDTVVTRAPSSTTGLITAIGPGGSDISDSTYTYTGSPPNVFGMVPDSGLWGVQVIIQGNNWISQGFAPDSVVFNPGPNQTSDPNPTIQSGTLRCNVPTGASSGPVVVHHHFGNVSPGNFKVLFPTPTVTISSSPGQVCQGEVATLTFDFPVGTPPFNFEYQAGSGTPVQVVNVGNGHAIPTVLNNTTTFSVNWIQDLYTSNNNPNYSKTITANNPPVAGWSHTANGTVVTFNNSSSGALTYEWDFGDGNTSNGVNPLHTYGSPGTYDVCLVAFTNNGCPDTVCQTISVISGLDDQLVGGTFKAYPNPVEDQMNFELELNTQGVAIIELIGMDGKSVSYNEVNLNGVLFEGIIDMGKLSSGTYVLKLTTPDGQQVVRKIQKD